MACNFWQSTHKREIDRVNSEEFRKEHDKATDRDWKEAQISKNGVRMLPMHLTQLIFKCCNMLELRVQVAASASVFMKRFLLRCGLTYKDPRIIAPTSLLFAAKVEEYSDRISYKLGADIRKEHMRDAVARCWNELVSREPNFKHREARVTSSELLELEFVLVDVLCDSIQVYHPYSALSGLLEDAGQLDLLSAAWSCVNDAYVSDVVLLWPPHIVAVACISIAAILNDVDLRQWQASLNCDTQQVAKVMSEVQSMYNMLNDQFGREVQDALTRCDVYFSRKR